MIFNSIHFALFFPVVTIGFFLLPHKHRWWWLLGASCYFYMAFRPVYILILGFTIVVDYYAALIIEKSEGSKRKQWLIASLVANIGVLVVFKYYNFLFHFFPSIYFDVFPAEYGVPFLDMALPIGLSFHTFQAMSYTIEVYRGNQVAERKFGFYSLYVMFYPQLVAGPIERPQNILPQFYEHKKFDYNQVKLGLQLMAWGFFKKVVIADRLAQFADAVFVHPIGQKGISVIVATFFFSFQIYCDFSGYSDIAIGAAAVMGFKLMKNFHNPYFATSIGEFWKRWHISLSTWFRDYLYIPLGGNRRVRTRVYFNLFLVFLVSGIWHGANVNYVLWGALHGVYLIIGLMTINYRRAALAAIGVDNEALPMRVANALLTFILVAFAWIAFRADYINTTLTKSLYVSLGNTLEIFRDNVTMAYVREHIFLGLGTTEFSYSMGLIVLLLLTNYVQEQHSVREIINRQKTSVRWGFYILSLLLFVYLGVFESDAQFIYFQF